MTKTSDNITTNNPKVEITQTPKTFVESKEAQDFILRYRMPNWGVAEHLAVIGNIEARGNYPTRKNLADHYGVGSRRFWRSFEYFFEYDLIEVVNITGKKHSYSLTAKGKSVSMQVQKVIDDHGLIIKPVKVDDHIEISKARLMDNIDILENTILSQMKLIESLKAEVQMLSK